MTAAAVTAAADRTAVATKRTAAIRGLARVEAGRMVRHPAFLFGLVVTMVLIQRPGEEAWAGQAYYTSAIAWTFFWMGTLTTAALVAGRQRMLSEPDLFPAVPVHARDRALATALALLGPAAIAALAAAGLAAVSVAGDGYLLGDGGYEQRVGPPFVEWAQPVLVAVLAGVVGIAIAHLRRGRVAVLGILMFGTFLGGTLMWAFQAHPIRVLHPVMYPSYERELPPSFDPATWSPGDPPLLPPDEWASGWREVRFDPAALGWHLVYLGGLIVLGVWWVARAAGRQDRSPPPRWLLWTGVPLLAVGGVAQILTAGMNS